MSKTPTIAILENGQVQISGFECALGRVAKQTIALAPFAGERVRIWLDESKKFSVDPHKDHYWQIAELDVPPQTFTETEVSAKEAGQPPTTIVQAVPLDLTNVEITAWPLPE